MDIYFNLHKRVFSIRHKGIVIAHANTLQAVDVTFIVNQKGREKVIAEGRKNVHAFIRTDHITAATGLVLTGNGDSSPLAATFNAVQLSTIEAPVAYNPYKYSSFVRPSTNEPVHTSARCTMAGPREVYAA